MTSTTHCGGGVSPAGPHLRHRPDAENIDLMGSPASAATASATGPRRRRRAIEGAAREAVYGMPYAEWKAAPAEATPEQLARMAESMKRNPGA